MQLPLIHKHTLSNGLTLLISPTARTPQVSIQLWYQVGSKHERSGQKGIAHLIEHMIFKGTAQLSESDINQITYKLSGYCNAFTSHDYTGYLFDFPRHNWHHALPIMADCMRNCTFREEFLASELKAVVQELKMYRDDYVSSLIERMMSSLFADHPYRYPVIGYKQDLWNLQRQELVDFYHQFYIPQRATLVIVGDVQIDDVIRKTEQAFGSIQVDATEPFSAFYHAQSLEASSTTLYRDIQQPTGIVLWEIPGIIARNDYLLDISSWLIGSGKGARLYRKLVDEQGVATNLDSFVYDLFEHGLFGVSFDAAEGVDPQQVAALIRTEMNHMLEDGFSKSELQRAIKKTAMDFVGLQEQNQKYANVIGRTYLALGDTEYCRNYTAPSSDPALLDNVHKLMEEYLRPAIMHEGYVLPVTESEKRYWLSYQEQSDAEDSRVLSAIVREAPVEEGVMVHSIESGAAETFAFPKPDRLTLSNGLSVLYHHDPSLPTVSIVLELPTKHFYDPESKQGLSMFLADLMEEGTENYPGTAFADAIEQAGMSLDIVPGLITLKALDTDLRHALTLLNELVQKATLADCDSEKIRQRLLNDVRVFWDTPTKCATQLLRSSLYGKHPYHKAALGTPATIMNISCSDLTDAYRAWITPIGSALAIVGNIIETGALASTLEDTLGSWTGKAVAEIDYPELPHITPPPTIIHKIQRDQIVLAYGRDSVSRLDADFDKLLLFDQIFTGGSLGSMSSRLFDLRERSGLFYTIRGSLVAGAAKQPGISFVSTIVSPDRLDEAQRQIKATIDEGAARLTHNELEEACRAMESSLIDLFSTHRQTAGAFLFLHEYALPDSYFEQRIQQLRAISKESVQEACARWLCSKRYTTVMVGRL